MSQLQLYKLSLLQRAALQTKANRYAFLKQSNDRKLITTIVNK